MSSLRFEWHGLKAVANLAKHGASFEEAQTVFYDDRALLIADPDASEREERFLLLGMSASARCLVVCHCERQGGDVLRIISARKADRRERQAYARRAEP